MSYRPNYNNYWSAVDADGNTRPRTGSEINEEICSRELDEWRNAILCIKLPEEKETGVKRYLT